jgi:hypothetical protein
MESGSTASDTWELQETLQAVIAEERRAAELCLRCAREVSEPALQAFLLRMSETHLQHLRTLQDSLSDRGARETITRQINEMFG